MPRMRLDKFLARSGFGTRGEVKRYVRSGVIAINGRVAKDPSRHIDTEKDTVTAKGQNIRYRQFTYLVFNKPAGVISATEDDRDTTVIDILPEQYQNFELFPVGRLDKDTEGLLLLTNDGKLAHRLLSPKHHVPKTYHVEVDGEITTTVMSNMEKGVTLDDGYTTKPAKIELIADESSSKALLTIYEGKFHQVKRMFKAFGLTVTYLKRVKMGPLELDPALALGNVRELTADEEEQLTKYTR